MKQKILGLIIAGILLLSGCTPGSGHSSQSPACQIVDKITVQFENGPLQAARVYTDPEKMRRILNYLRLVRPYGQAQEDPEKIKGSHFRITLSHSDGCQKLYEQRSDRFFSEDNGPWMQINPQKAQELSIILGEMESDGP